MKARPPASLRTLLFDGMADAAGCLIGGLLGLGAGRLLGLELPAGNFSNSSLIGIALIVLGASMGVRLARRWRARYRHTARAATLPEPGRKR